MKLTEKLVQLKLAPKKWQRFQIYSQMHILLLAIALAHIYDLI
jgi:hypothetical protein